MCNRVLRDKHVNPVMCSLIVFLLENSRNAKSELSRFVCVWALVPPLCLYAGTNPSRPGGFPGANSPGPVADLYGPSSQDSAVGNYISAASPQPGSGFGPSITVSMKNDWAASPLSVLVPLKAHSQPKHTARDSAALENTFITLYYTQELTDHKV